MKRFTETTKWSKPWFRRLDPEAKLLWQWLLDNCDCAGIIEPDWELAAFQIGTTKPLERSLEALAGRVEKIGEKLFIPKFIEYQYGQELNPANTAHRGVIKRLQLAGIETHVTIKEESKNKAPSKPLQSPYKGAQDIDKDKDKDQSKDQEEGSEKPISGPGQFASFEDVLKYAKGSAQGISEECAEAFFDKMEALGWVSENGLPLRNWQARFRSFATNWHNNRDK